jgi:glucan 1,3-beta-glucosidase
MNNQSSLSPVRAAGLFVLAALSIAAFWWWLGRPVAMPPLEVGGAHKLQCVSYAPFRGAQNPLNDATRVSAKDIDDDLSRLSMITDCVRTYSIRHGLDQIPEIARRHGLKVIQGIWLSSNPVTNRQEIETAVGLANRFPDVVQSIVVGNEVLLRGELSGPDLAQIIRDVKAQVKAPVTYADVWEFWLRHRDVYEAVDFVTIHILPYWEDLPIAADAAADHVDQIRRRMVAAFPSKEILIGETGYPSQGRMREGALPSPAHQAKVLHEIVALARRDGFRVNLIEAFDQPWKRQLEGTVGGFWGLLDADTRAPKFEWGRPLSNHPRWLLQMGCGIAFAALVLGAAYAAMRRTGRGIGTAASAGLFVIAATAGATIGLAVERVLIESLGTGGWLRSGVMVAMALIAPPIAAASLARGDPLPTFAATVGRPGARRDPLTLALGLAFVVTTLMAVQLALGLVFDPRYKDFPFSPMTSAILPFVVLSALAPRPAGIRQPAEMAAAAVLLLSVLYILPNEGFENWQSVWLCGLFALLGLTLVRVRGARG